MEQRATNYNVPKQKFLAYTHTRSHAHTHTRTHAHTHTRTHAHTRTYIVL